MSTAMGVVPFTFTPGLTTEINDFKDGRKHFVSMSVEVRLGEIMQLLPGMGENRSSVHDQSNTFGVGE